MNYLDLTYSSEFYLDWVSIILAGVAAVAAIYLIPLAGNAGAWLLFSAAMVLLAIDRVIESLGHAGMRFDPITYEIISDMLGIGMAGCLLGSVYYIRDIFLERKLVSNGVEAMPEGGTLEIRAVKNKPDATVTVSVRDSGSGIAPEVLKNLFQPLFTTKARGIGLGLVVVKNLVEANGGSVKVVSEAGKGATFFVTLPCDSSTIKSA